MSMGGPLARPDGHPAISGMSAAGNALLPRWVAAAWLVVLLLIVVSHCHPLLALRGRRRWWHCLHLAMAVSMALMYASGSFITIGVSGRVWSMVFVAAAALAAGMLASELRDGSSGWLWPLATVDLIAMAYMLRSGRPIAAISWLLVAHLVAETVFWTTRRGRRLAGRTHVDETSGARTRRSRIGRGGLAIGERRASPGGHVLAPRHYTLQLAMMLMTASMAYMLIGMQLSA